MSVSISSKYGIEGSAPFLVQAMAPAFAAILRESLDVLPLSICARKYPVKVSPAAVVSIASTLNAV